MSPTVYKPLILSIVLLTIQSCAGDAYINKFIIQILNSDEKQAQVSTSVAAEEACMSEGGQNYILPLVIMTVKLIVILLMTFLLRKIRIRLLYFSSMVLTVILLVLLGIISDTALSSSLFSSTTTKYIKMVLLCVHVIVIQLGLQSLPGLIMDVLYPKAYKAVLKGFSISIGSVFLIVLILTLKSVSYSYSFWIMGCMILIAMPFLYIYLPEIRNIGTDMCADFFLPFQTVFNVPLPEHKKGSVDERLNAQKNWKHAVKRISTLNVFKTAQVMQKVNEDNLARKYPKVHFDKKIDDIESILKNPELKQLNKDRVSLVSNLLSQDGFLCTSLNKDESRILILSGSNLR